MQGRQGVESPAACIEDCIGLCTSLRKISRGRTKDVQGAAVCVIACVCGDRLHDIALCKPGYTQQFATHRPSFVRLQARRKSTVRIPLQLLMSGSSVSLDSLPDLGIFMPGVLQKRFFFPSATRHHDRARASINQWCKAYVARGSRTTQLAGSACASLLHESIPCLKRVKRSQKGFVLKESMGTRDVKACISVMFGTILKLYPLGSKTPTFRCRVNMMDRIESLMQGTTDEMIGFINTNMDLVKLCFMEYTTYMFSYNMPCERKILMSHSAMEQYEPTCINMCDSFRQEAVATGLETWDVMNASARACIERCIRICKFKMLRIADVCLKAYVDPLLFSERSLQFKCVNGDPEAMGSFHPGSSSQEQRVALSLQGNIVCRPLPDSVTALQRESLWRLYSACGKKMRAAHTIDFCCICAINEKSFCTKMRMCSLSRQLSCVKCKPGTILSVDMMGVLLIVCHTSYYLCPCCLKLCVWNADGHDLCPMMLADGGRAPRGGVDADDPCTCYVPSVPQPGHPHPKCVVCAGRHIGRHVVTVPDHSRRAVVVSYFCSRHMPPPHVMANVHNMGDLVDAVKARL